MSDGTQNSFGAEEPRTFKGESNRIERDEERVSEALNEFPRMSHSLSKDRSCSPQPLEEVGTLVPA